MSDTVVIMFGATLFLALHAGYWVVRARRLGRVAAWVGRVFDDTDVGEVELSPARLAKSVWLRELLARSYVADRLALLLEQSGLELTVAALLARLGLSFTG